MNNEHRERIRQWQQQLLNLANTLGYRISGMVEPTQFFYDDLADELGTLVTRIQNESINHGLAVRTEADRVEKLKKKEAKLPGDGQSEIR